MTSSHSAENNSSLQSKSRSLFSIGEDLERLNEILDETGDDIQQQEILNEWLQQLGTERDRKLDGYAASISEMQARAEARKAEAQRLMELAKADERRAQLLKERLKWFFESQQLKTIETTRYRLSLSKNGGKAPLILKPDLSPHQLPERFTTTSIEPNTSAIRAALEAGEALDFASLGDRGTSIRIK